MSARGFTAEFALILQARHILGEACNPSVGARNDVLRSRVFLHILMHIAVKHT